VHDLRTNKTFLSKKRSDIYLYNEQGWIVRTDRGTTPYEEFYQLQNEAYLATVKEQDKCIIPIPLPPLEDEMCLCYMRNRSEYQPVTPEVKNCIAIQVNHEDTKQLSASNLVIIVVNSCEDKLLVKDLAIQAMNQKGLPIGQWVDVPNYDNICKYKVQGPKQIVFRRPQLQYGEFQKKCIVPSTPLLLWNHVCSSLSLSNSSTLVCMLGIFYIGLSANFLLEFANILFSIFHAPKLNNLSIHKDTLMNIGNFKYFKKSIAIHAEKPKAD